jgi:hypothetical protein
MNACRCSGRSSASQMIDRTENWILKCPHGDGKCCVYPSPITHNDLNKKNCHLPYFLPLLPKRPDNDVIALMLYVPLQKSFPSCFRTRNFSLFSLSLFLSVECVYLRSGGGRGERKYYSKRQFMHEIAISLHSLSSHRKSEIARKFYPRNLICNVQQFSHNSILFSISTAHKKLLLLV